MTENSKTKDPEVLIEISFKFQMKDYKFRLATKRAWLVALSIVAIRLVSYLFRGST